jgi:hypothetical protein
MKKNIFLVFGLLVLLTSCSHVRTLSTGISNEGFIELLYSTSDQKYDGGVDVTIDDKAPFKAVVNKDKAKSSKGNIYAISNGTHMISVAYKGQLLYKKQVFVSSQQTIKIKLP